MIPRKVDLLIPDDPFAAVENYRGTMDFSRSVSSWTIRCIPFSIDNLAQRLRYGQADGIICFGTGDHPEIEAPLLSLGVPLVGGEVDNHQRIPAVLLHHVRYGRVAAEHLIAIGCDHFAFCGHQTAWSRLREEGFLTVLGTYGHDVHLLDPKHQRSWDELLDPDRLSRWLRRLPLPCGLMACNDEVANAVVTVALDMGLSIPHELAVIGVDNSHVHCECCACPITSVSCQHYLVSWHLARILHDLMEGRPPPDKPLFLDPPDVTIRASTRRPGSVDALVTAALYFAENNLGEPIGPTEMAHAAHCSPRTLLRRFQKVTGRGPGEKLREMRLDRATKLLLDSNMKLVDIAVACGFLSPAHFCRIFKQAKGISPSQFRRGKQPSSAGY